MASFRPSFPLIARVYPMDGSFTQHVINHNRTRYREAFPIQPLNATPPNTRFGQYANLPYLQLSFDNPPRHSQGFLFGHSRSICDVVLDEELGLRDVHFMVGFTKDYDDGLYRLVVRDLGSSTGTMVTYGARATDFRQDFTWTISGYGFVDESEIIIIAAYGKEYAIVPMLYDMRDTGYIYAVESYTAGLPRYFPRIDVTSRSAAFKALPATITEGQLMDGPRGTTRKIWDPTTARAFAQKSVVLTPEIDRRAWCQHVRRLANLDHVSFFFFFFILLPVFCPALSSSQPSELFKLLMCCAVVTLNAVLSSRSSDASGTIIDLAANNSASPSFIFFAWSSLSRKWPLCIFHGKSTKTCSTSTALLR